METLKYMLAGLAICLQPYNLICCILGGVLGVIVGALPGLGSVAGTAILLPLTYSMNPTAAIIMLAAVYYGNMFGGAISAILINIPGDAPAVMTALDGYKMTQNGKAGKALFTAFVSSFLGGLIGGLLLVCLGVFMSRIGLKFGPPEMAMLILVALTSIGWILGDSAAKGLVATGIGLLLAAIGIDAQTGQSRLTFGTMYLLGGIPFIPTVIGLFGMSQVIQTLVKGIEKKNKVIFGKIRLKDSLLSKKEVLELLPVWLRGTIGGFFIGLLPGSGATTAAFLTYITEKRVNRRRQEMGTGIPQGIASSESSNNAASMGAFVPLLSLGVPGSGTAAVLIGGLMMWGFQPGPLFMSKNMEFSWALIASMLTGDIIIAAICILAIPWLMNLLKIPNTILVPVIICASIMGSFSVNNNMTDIIVMLLAGVLGYAFLKFELPMAPLALTLVLGASLETAIRQTFTISYGSPWIFFTRPISLGFFIFGAMFVIIPAVMNVVKKRKAKHSD